MHLQSAQAGVLFGTVFAEESRPGRHRRGLPSFLLFLGGADVRHDAGALHPLTRAVREDGFWAGGVRAAALVFLSAAAGAAAEAAGGTQVQGARGARGLRMGGGQIEGREDAQVPHQSCGEAGGGAVCCGWDLSKRIGLQGSIILTFQFTVVWFLLGEILLYQKGPRHCPFF